MNTNLTQENISSVIIQLADISIAVENLKNSVDYTTNGWIKLQDNNVSEKDVIEKSVNLSIALNYQLENISEMIAKLAIQ